MGRLFGTDLRRSGTSLLLFLLTTAALALQAPPGGKCFVYPSPATGDMARVVYKLPSSGTARISVYNEAGDLVAQTQSAGGAGIQQTPLDLTHYRDGVYLCRVVLDLDSGVRQSLPLFKFIVDK